MIRRLYRYAWLLTIGLAMLGCTSESAEEPVVQPEEPSTPTWEPVAPNFIDEDD